MPSGIGSPSGRGQAVVWGLLDDCVGPRARLLRNALAARSIAVSEPFGLPTGSLTVMALIAANPSSSQSELAEQAGWATPSLVGLIDELEKRDLVRRVRSKVDRRRNDMVLTPKGETTLNELFDTVTKIEDPIREALGPKDFAQLGELLDRAIAGLKDT